MIVLYLWLYFINVFVSISFLTEAIKEVSLALHLQTGNNYSYRGKKGKKQDNIVLPDGMNFMFTWKHVIEEIETPAEPKYCKEKHIDFKDLLYRELEEDVRPTGRPRLRYKDVCTKDVKTASINVNNWESCANDRSTWRLAVRQGFQKAEEDRNKKYAEMRARKKAKQKLSLELHHRLL